MTVYSYVALKNNKETVKGKIEAENMRQARDAIRQLGLLPVKVFEDANKAEEIAKIATVKLRPLSLRERIDFTTTYQTLAASGVPVVESLVFMEQDAASPRIRALAREIRRHIIAGATFADTVKRYSYIFGPIYVGLTKAGEDSGEMEKTMGRLHELLRKQEATKAKVIGALMYPVFVIILAIVVVIVMLTFVFPAFKEMFENAGKDLPWITAMCMNAGVFMREYWYSLPILFLSAGSGIYYAFKWEPSRNLIDKYALKIPIISDLLRFGNFANYLAVLQVAYEAGVPIVNCLVLATMTLDNETLRTGMIGAKNRVQQGQHLSVAFRNTGLVPKMILFMVATGEQSGRLGEMLIQATKFIDEELARAVDTMTKAIEPIMLLVIGAIVLVLASALYIPLFQLGTLAG